MLWYFMSCVATFPLPNPLVRIVICLSGLFHGLKVLVGGVIVLYVGGCSCCSKRCEGRKVLD